MIWNVLLGFMIFIGFVPVCRADGDADEMLRIRRQAQDERRKEEQIQILRLELEKLKLEVETRKTLREMGQGVESTITGQPTKVRVEVKNIVVMPDGARAVLEVAGNRMSVKAKDSAGPYRVDAITPEQVILVDEAGTSLTIGLN